MRASTDASLLVVAGSGRSGTSLLSGLVHQLGVHSPQPEVAANRNNPRGYGEPRWAVDFDRRMLRSVDVVLEDARPVAWEHTAKVAERDEARTELTRWLREQFEISDRVVVKDPHLTWICDLYRVSAEQVPARLAMATMLRHPLETTKSRDLAYGGTASATSRLAAWVNVMLHLEARTRDLPRALVRYEQLLTDWRKTLEQADESLRMGLVSAAGEQQLARAGSVVDPGLYRAAGSWSELDVPVHLRDVAEETWAALGRLADGEPARSVYDDLDQLRDSYVTLYRDAREIARSSVVAAHRRNKPRPAAPEARDRAAQVRPSALEVRRRARGALRRARAAARPARRAVGTLWRSRSTRPRGAALPVRIVVHDVNEAGGVARATVTLANALADRHQVEIISMTRTADRARFAIDDRVSLTYLMDTRGGGRGTNRTPTEAMPRLRDVLSSLSSGVVVSTRPLLHKAVARDTPADVVKIAVAHSPLEMVSEHDRARLAQTMPQLEAVVTMTEQERTLYEELRGPDGPPVVAIPNALPDQPSPARRPPQPVICAAGSLVPNKGFDRLIEAFAPLAADFPDWQLHIYGRGRLRQSLEDLAVGLGLDERVVLHGFRRDFPRRVSEASIFALSSHYESFSLVLLEAMASGVPVISFDCPSGPRHLITSERNGLLVPDGDVAAFTEGLRRLMADQTLRARLGAAGERSSHRYTMREMANRWERLFERVARPAR